MIQNAAVIEIVGWLGALLLLIVYVLVSAGLMKASARPYQLANVLGALALTANALWHHALPSAGLNAVWMMAGLLALLRRTSEAP
jgi:hypothetical protein